MISPLLANIFLHYVLDEWSDSVQEVMEHGDILVFGHNSVPYRTLRERIKPEQAIIDLARLWADYKTFGARYHGIT
ncbi:hypothetical protein ACFL0S_04320 [Thermodesulfobacteriota bacterium]